MHRNINVRHQRNSIWKWKFFRCTRQGISDQCALEYIPSNFPGHRVINALCGLRWIYLRSGELIPGKIVIILVRKVLNIITNKPEIVLAPGFLKEKLFLRYKIFIFLCYSTWLNATKCVLLCVVWGYNQFTHLQRELPTHQWRVNTKLMLLHIGTEVYRLKKPHFANPFKGRTLLFTSMRNILRKSLIWASDSVTIIDKTRMCANNEGIKDYAHTHWIHYPEAIELEVQFKIEKGGNVNSIGPKELNPFVVVW